MLLVLWFGVGHVLVMGFGVCVLVILLGGKLYVIGLVICWGLDVEACWCMPTKFLFLDKKAIIIDLYQCI